MPPEEHKTDAELLERFSGGGSHADFAALVKRHGPMVHAVSMRILSNHHDAEDVTQATFLALAREAGKLIRQPSVAGWLHTVSRRLSLDVRKSRESRQRREQLAMNESLNSTPDASLGAGFRRELDAALERLPDRYRQPLVLFHLEGASLNEVARRLELEPSTLRTRLSRAREMLRQLLGRRGVEVASVGALGALFTAEAKAAAFTPTLLSTVLIAGTGRGTAVSPRILELAGKAAGAKSIELSSTFTTLTILMKTKATLVTAIVIALVVVGTTGYVVNQSDGAKSTESRAAGRDFSPAGPRQDRFKAPERKPADPLSRISSEDEFWALMESVLLIGDDAKRLAAIRNRLGMDISDAAYREAIAAHGYAVEPENLLTLLAEAWIGEDPVAAMSWARKLPDRFGDWFTRKMLASWSTKDEASARAWAKDHLGPEDLEIAKQGLENLQSRPSPDSSAETAAGLRRMQEQMLAISGTDPQAQKERDDFGVEFNRAFSKWAARDPSQAIEFWASMDEETRKCLPDIGHVFRIWARVDPDAALERAKALTDASDRADALVEVLPAWQLKHPDKTITEAADLGVIPDERYEVLVYRIVSDWATADPSRALDFAMAIEDPGQQKRAVGVVVKSWVRKAPEQAREWVTTQPAGDLRDAGLSEISDRLARTDFASADRLVREIKDPEVKRNTIDSILSTSDALGNHLAEALRLADEELPRMDYMALHTWANKVAPEDAPRFRSWLEKANAAGRIRFNTYSNPEGVDSETVKRFNERSAAQGVRFILEGLKGAEENE